MKNNNYWITLVLALSLVTGTSIFAQSADEAQPDRAYSFELGMPVDMQFIASNAIAMNKLTQDSYDIIGPRLPGGVEKVGRELWSILWTYMYTLWPHEFGHSVRTDQTGGKFVFHNYAFPFPHTTVTEPPNMTLEESAIISSAGFEINSLIKWKTTNKYHFEGSARIDEIDHAAVNQMFLPIYAFLVFPADPSDPETWIETRGDPVHMVLPVYEWYTGRSAIMAGGEVDPELVDYYKETTLLSLVTMFLDPMFLQYSKGMFASSADRSHRTAWSLGNDKLRWSYSTHFNPSPLGYEVYLNQFFSIQDHQFSLYVKHGAPFSNAGLGVNIPSILRKEDLNLGLTVDVWDQDIYGRGGAIGLQSEYSLNERLALSIKGEWKDRGYLMGRSLDDSFQFHFGINLEG